LDVFHRSGYGRTASAGPLVRRQRRFSDEAGLVDGHPANFFVGQCRFGGPEDYQWILGPALPREVCGAALSVMGQHEDGATHPGSLPGPGAAADSTANATCRFRK